MIRSFALRAWMCLGCALILIPIAAGGGALGALRAWLERAPTIDEFNNYNPPETTTLQDKDGFPFASLFEQRRIVVPIRQMNPCLPDAFVAIEDERFYRHMGVDPMGVARAAWVNLLRGKSSQGASTITQQTARNLIPAIGNDKTPTRKFVEMLVAFQMEHSYSKEQILEVYLNQIYLGSGSYGVEAAAKTFFAKSTKDLSPEECATLAGLPQLPEKYSPLNNPELARRRRDQVLARMWEQGYLGVDQYENAVTQSVTTSGNAIVKSKAPYFVDAVRRVVAEHPQLGGDKLQTAGWRIKTTIDPEIQRIAESVMRESLETEEKEWLAGRQERWLDAKADQSFMHPPAENQIRMGEVAAVFEKSLVVKFPGGWRADLDIPPATESYFRKEETIAVGDGVDLEITGIDQKHLRYKALLLPRQRIQGALVCLDAATGDVRAIVGGREYNDPANNGFFNRAILAHRQAGSTFKPLFYACGFEHGLTPSSVFYDGAITFADGYSPRNYENKFFGSTALETALIKSRNIPTIKLVQQIGLREATDYVRRFQRVGDEPWDLPLEWPVVLGTTSVTPLELAAAYQAIANRGVARGPRMIERVWNQDDREAIGIPERTPNMLIGPQADAYIQQSMMNVLTHGTGASLLKEAPLPLRMCIAGKSGTTNDNRDAWFAGFTAHEVAVVWIGFDQNILLAPHRTGSKAAGPIWATFMQRVWELKTPEQQAAGMLRLPKGFLIAAINPSTGRIVEPNSAEWIEPPTWRAFTQEEYNRRSPAGPTELATDPEAQQVTQLLVP
ncbi:PBP1A family penicillin-binding protein [Candidatus Sumerlaeota bacterium]|nr:PBP1A family penicillin-binding protein [Candidatus Sumerlaeota bacterium]